MTMQWQKIFFGFHSPRLRRTNILNTASDYAAWIHVQSSLLLGCFFNHVYYFGLAKPTECLLYFDSSVANTTFLSKKGINLQNQLNVRELVGISRLGMNTNCIATHFPGRKNLLFVGWRSSISIVTNIRAKFWQYCSIDVVLSQQLKSLSKVSKWRYQVGKKLFKVRKTTLEQRSNELWTDFLRTG